MHGRFKIKVGAILPIIHMPGKSVTEHWNETIQFCALRDIRLVGGGGLNHGSLIAASGEIGTETTAKTKLFGGAGIYKSKSIDVFDLRGKVLPEEAVKPFHPYG